MKVGAIKRFVLDASVALAWCFPDEATSGTEAILDSLANGTEALAPGIWPFEVANALLVGERRKRVTVAQVASLLQRVAALPISLDSVRVDRTFDQVLSFARQEQLSEYGAAYLELALREGLPLATLDESLRSAATRAGIALLRT